MLRRAVLTVGLLGACVWCLLLVARATSVEAAPTEVAFPSVSPSHTR